jgi:phage shock protein E
MKKVTLMNLRIRTLSWLFALLLLTLLTISACGGSIGSTEPQAAYAQVTEQGALLLDVRTPEEFRQNRIKGARNIPITELKQRLQVIETLVAGDRDHPIVVYCARGYRASQAQEILLDAGFKKVTNLGGIHDWPEPEAVQ